MQRALQAQRLRLGGGEPGRGDANPLAHVATAARALLNSTPGAAAATTWSLAATAALTLVRAPIALSLYARQC